MKQLSKKNPYYIPHHKKMELMHFCYQYQDWHKELNDISLIKRSSTEVVDGSRSNDELENVVIRRMSVIEKIEMVEKVAELTDPELKSYILRGVTTKASYDNLRLMYGIPCCRNVYYDLYHKFFYILSYYR